METTAGMTRDLIARGEQIRETYRSRVIMAAVAVGTPVNGIVEVAGPEALPMDECVRRFLRATDDARPVIADAHAGYFGTALYDDSG